MTAFARRPAARRLALSLAVLLLLAALAGCATRPAPAPSPAFADAAFQGTLKRRLTFTPYGNEQASRELIGLIALDETQLRAVLLTPFGQRLVTLVHDADGSRFVPGDIPPEALREALPVTPEWLASRLEWSLWPVAALREAFAGSRWSIAVIEDSRVIRHDGDIVARITPARADADDTRWLDDRQGRYRLRIAPLDAPDDAPPGLQEPDNE